MLNPIQIDKSQQIRPLRHLGQSLLEATNRFLNAEAASGAAVNLAWDLEERLSEIPLNSLNSCIKNSLGRRAAADE